MVAKYTARMADDEDLRAARQGADSWNAWRVSTGVWQPNLSYADLAGINFAGADLSGTNLTHADLSGANLRAADFRGAFLREANLRRATLVDANFEGAWLALSDLSEADLTRANFVRAGFALSTGASVKLHNSCLVGAIFTPRGDGGAHQGFLELASAEGIETAQFADERYLTEYLEEAFEYIHRPQLEERDRVPQFVEKALANIKLLQRLYSSKADSSSLFEVIDTITVELVQFLKAHPNELFTLKPRQFEVLVGEILASYGWDVVLTPASKDGGYDLFAITRERAGVSTSWIIECKKYAPENKVGVEVIRALWGVKQDLRVANALLATTSTFTAGAEAFKSSRYDLELRDYEGILDWLNQYHPDPNGKLYIRDHKLVLPHR